MSFARLRERFQSPQSIRPSDTTRRRLYDRIHEVAGEAQRDELLVMAQRLEKR
ncbi:MULTISPECIES: hypothetical protein [Gordonia]|uniref:hypothetical protein n=1 Tax=Gordonia TaxID=2053 RepID=UPI0002BD9571|nr:MULTISPECIES: hypothetical protein [Gordonia]WLP91249.1 hypothetical protein Q9K23_02950 [Gordonia sp. NB41Y]